MAKSTYQTFTVDTPMDTFRADFIHRSAVCAALEKRYPGLGAIGAEAEAVVAQIDTRRAQLQQAEDDQIRARALEDARRLDVADVYTELRRTLFAKKYDVLTLLPDAPSSIARLGTKNFRTRAEQAVANLDKLPPNDPVRAALLGTLNDALAEFTKADEAEDVTRASLSSGRMALVLYKTELSQAREMELGAVLKVIGDSEKIATFALPWRKSSKAGDDEPTTNGAPAPAPASP